MARFLILLLLLTGVIHAEDRFPPVRQTQSLKTTLSKEGLIAQNQRVELKPLRVVQRRPIAYTVYATPWWMRTRCANQGYPSPYGFRRYPCGAGPYPYPDPFWDCWP